MFAVELMTPGGDVRGEVEEETLEELRLVTSRPSCRLLAPPVREAAWMVRTSFPPAVAEGIVWSITRGGEEVAESPLARTVRGTDWREPGEVITIGTDVGALMVLKRQNKQA